MMKRIMLVATAIVIALAAVGCKDKCMKACEEMEDCLGADLECKKCKDVDGMDKSEAKDAAKCILDLSCDDMKDPNSTKLEECNAQ